MLFPKKKHKMFSNAAGVLDTTREELNKLAWCTTLDQIVTKTCTLLPRTGNVSSPFLHVDEKGSCNNIGCRNKGIEYYLTWAKEYWKECKAKKAASKTIVVSLLADDDLASLLHKVGTMFASSVNWFGPEIRMGVEINMSCPNISSQQMSRMLFQHHLMEVLEILESMPHPLPPVSLKLPPIVNKSELLDVCEHLLHTSSVQGLTCCNTLAGGMIFDLSTRKPKMTGSMGGSCLKPIALHMIHTVHQKLPRMLLTACGGISTGKDCAEFWMCGATSFQIGTALLQEVDVSNVLYRLQQEFRLFRREVEKFEEPIRALL